MCFKNILMAVGVPALVLVSCQQTQETKESQPVQGVQPAVKPAAKPVAQPAKTTTGVVSTDLPKKPMHYEPVQVPGGFVPKAVGRRVSRVSVPGPYVALTFDDGPNPSTTPKILDILRQHGARATFFVAGENAVNNKKLLARAAAEGHEIGCHTYSHIKMTGSSDEKIASEVSRTNAIIQAATGRKPALMRPPYGATNARIVDKMFNEYGMYSVLWDVDTQDWRHPGVSVVIHRAVGNARPGSIILVHDIHASTLAAVSGIVTGLQARGFKLVTVSQLIALGGGSAPAPAAPAAPAVQPEPAAPAAQPEPAPAAAGEPQAEPAATAASDAPAQGAAEIAVGATQD